MIRARICLITAFSPLIQAWAGGAFGGFANPDGDLHLDARGEVWNNAIASSNASGTITIPGYNVSKPWPGEAMDGWTINITAIDLHRDPMYENGQYSGAIGTDLRIIAPDSLYVTSTNKSDGGMPIVDVNKDWVFCMWHWFSPAWSTDPEKYNPGDKKMKPDGSCEQWITPACISALEREASTAYSIRSEPLGRYGQRHVCNDFDIPVQCDSVPRVGDGNPMIPYVGLPLKYLNGTTTEQGGYLLGDDDENLEDVQQMWRVQTKIYDPIITMFGRLTDPEDSTEPGFAKLSCIMPSEKSAEDEKNEADDKSSDSKDDKKNDNKDSAGSLITISIPMLGASLAALALLF